MFGRKRRAEKLKKQAESNSLVPTAALAAAYAGAKPVLERLLYDDDLRDNIRTFIESARSILDELSDEDPTEIITKLWNDDKLRGQVEAAAGAASQGSKRVRGERVRTSGGRGGRLLFLLLAAAVGFLFLNPRTGPQARKFARDTYGSLTSGE
ncbi:hypothetical protein AVDCRST_MAG82-1367 [uncultured Rubrobacteraceae bacterium]|uniref:Uncharacterized protein n=1 Tax=uncultured Rubrobacteraceae bacterium TaxID=349277 RepID=A0A6J4PP63_9ACTN|nr:hypothetical protein AVDCRST_MAG82-1367 [uncultured Rubrobacteraceae bacterium]